MDQQPNMQPQAAAPSKHFKSFWPITIIATLAVIVGGVIVWISYNQRLSDDILSMVMVNHKQTEKVVSSQQNGTATVKFSGIIESVKNEQPVDGALTVEVDNKWVIIGGSGGMSPGTEVGSIIGVDFSNLNSMIGKHASVYAQKTSVMNNSNFTILGNRDYYFKVTD